MLKVRPFTFEEQLSLLHWQGADNVQAYIVARILLLSQIDWPISDIAFALMINEDDVRDIIQTFNERGLEPLAPRP
jgi:hypothetical protein